MTSRETTLAESRKTISSLNGKPNMRSHWVDSKHDEDGGNEALGHRPQDGRQWLADHLNALRVSEGELAAPICFEEA